MSSSLAISLTTALSSDEIESFGRTDREAGAHHVEPLLRTGQRLELPRDDVVLGAADGLRLELCHLGDEDRSRLIEQLVLLELALDDRGLAVADVEIGVRRAGDRVGRPPRQPGLVGRHRLEPADDAAHTRGFPDEGLGLGQCRLGVIGGRGALGAEDPMEHVTPREPGRFG